MENSELQALHKAFEEKLRREMGGSRDSEWLLTRHEQGYASIPVNREWEAFKARHLAWR